MAEEVAAGYVSLYARMEGAQVASEISSVLESAASTAAGAFSGFGDIVSGIGKDLTIMSVGADALLTKAGKGIIDTISVGENAAITFNTMGKAMGEAEGFADSFISKLNDFAVRTPFEFTNILPAVKQLMAMGYTANEILDDNNKGILTSAGNAAAALGLTDQGLSNILLQFGHIKSMGKAMSFQLNAMARNGLPVWDMLADHLKMTKEEVRDLVRAGKLDADTTIEALMNGMEKYEGMMEAMSHSLSGILSNMSDALHKPILEMYNSESYKRFEDSMYSLVEPLTNLMTALQPTLDVIFDQMAKGVDIVREKVQQLTGWLNGQNPHVLADIFKNAVVALNSGPLLLLLGKGSNAIGNAIGGFGSLISSQFAVASKGASLFRDQFAAVRESFALAKTPVKEFGAGLSLVKDEAGSFAKMRMNSVIDSFRHSAKMGAVDARLFGKEMLGILGFSTKTKNGFTAMSTAAKNVHSVYKMMIPTVGNLAKAAFPALITAVQSVGRMFASVSKQLLGTTTVVSIVSAAVVTLMAVFNSFGVNVADTVAKALVGFEQFVASIPEKMASLGNMFQDLLDSGQLEALAVQLTQKLPQMLSSAVASVFEGLENPAIGEAVLKMVDIIAETIAVNGPILLDGLLTAIGVAFQGIAEAIPIVAAHIPEFMVGIGNAIIENAPVILESFIQALAGLGAAFDVFLKQLSQNLGEASVGKDLTAIDTSVEELQQTVDGLNTQPFVDMATAVGQLAAAIGSIVIGVIEGIVDALNSPGAQAIAADIASAISGIADNCKRLVDTGAAEDFGNLLATLGGDLAKTAVDTVRSLTTLVGDLAGTYQNLKLVMENGVDFSSWKLEDQAIYINNVYQNLLHLQEGNSLVFGEGTSMADGYLDSVRGISPELDNFIDHLKSVNGTQDLVEQENKTLSDGMEIMKQKLEGTSGAADGLNGALSNMKFDDITRKATGMADGMEGSFRRAINSTSGFSGQLSSNLSGASGSMGRVVSDAGVMAGGLESQFDKAGKSSNKLPPPVQAAMKNAINQVNLFVGCVRAAEGSVSSHVSGIAGAFDALWGIDLYGAGQAIMSGFLSGLQSMWGAVQAFILMIGPWMKMFKGPLDYDRRLLVPAGKAIMSGLYKGLQSSFKGQVMPLVTSMAGTIDQAFEGVTSPLPSNVSVSMAGMANGDVRGPVIMQPVWYVYGVNDPETFAHQSMRAMIQLANSEE